MMNVSDNITRYPVPSGKRLRYLVALAMSMAILYSVLLVAFHHHDDGRDHDDDCPVCTVAHHSPAGATITAPCLTYLPFTFPACFAILALSIVVTRFCHTPQDRAPPV